MRRAFAALAVFALVTLALTWPLLARFGSAVAPDAGDPLLNTWLLWWSSRTLPLTAAWWNAPMFYPAPSVMALSELLIGVLPISAPVQWITGNPHLAYNAAFLLSFPLCGVAAYLLADELTGRRDAACVAGLAFMLAPYRMGQLGHLQMLAYYGAPLALAALHRYKRTKSRAALAAFAAAWMLQALSNGYALFHVAVLVGLWILWFAPTPRLALPIAAAWLAGSLPLVPVLATYWRVHHALHLSRDIVEIKRYSADISDFLSVPEGLMLWGRWLTPSAVEAPLFPGLTMVAGVVLWGWWAWRNRARVREPRPAAARILTWISLAAVFVGIAAARLGPLALGPLGVVGVQDALLVALATRGLAMAMSGPVRRAWQAQSPVAFYLLVVLTGYALSLGPEWRLLGRPLLTQTPYAWLLHLPGFDGLRVPARFATLASLGQATLLAFGLARASASPRRAWLPIVVALGVLADGWARLPVVPLAPGARADWSGIAAIVELPLGKTMADCAVLSHATSYPVPVVNGYSGYTPPHYSALVSALDAGQYDVLHEIAPRGVLAVVLRADTPDGARVAASLQRAEGIERQADADGWAVFHVMPRDARDSAFGPVLPVRAVRAAQNPEQSGAMLDGRVETAWNGGGSQNGDEALTIDLGEPRDVGALVLQLGQFTDGFPRVLAIDASVDGVQWVTAWRGATARATVRAGLANPTTVPLSIAIDATRARYVRLRQTASAPGVPWWIAELEVRGVAAAAAH